jgi:hydroxymethylpyrimidine pyrophosphatase-like HAD family hydrolase
VQKGLVMENAHDKLKESLSHLEIIGHHSKDAVARYLEGYFSL